MNKVSILSLLLSIVMFQTAFGNMPQSVNTQLKNVTVYKSGAALTHTAKLNLQPGNQEIVLNEVATNIVENSIQIALPAHVTLMSIITAKDYFPIQKDNAAIQTIDKQIQQLNKQQLIFKKDIQALEKTLGMLSKNEALGGNDKGTNVAELSKMTEYYLAQQKKLNHEIIDLNSQIDVLRDSVTALQNKRNALHHNAVNNAGQIILQVAANTATTIDVQIEYLSPNAQWTAAYDLRADKIAAPLKIFYKANIAQHTGIDWKQVPLKLSTGLPTQGGIAPVMHAWLVDYFQPVYNTAAYDYSKKEKVTNIKLTRAIAEAAPGIKTNSDNFQSMNEVQIRGYGSTDASSNPLYVVDGSPFMGDITDIDPETIDRVQILKDASATSLYGSRGANGVVVITTKGKGIDQYTEMVQQAMNATFDISIPYTIISNNKSHSVQLKEFNHKVAYTYLAIPKLDEQVYLVANIKDYAKLHLLPGEASIIFENMYVGKTFIDPFSTSDSLNLSMGRDRSILTERKLIPENSTIKTSGNYKKQTYEYELTIRNNKKDKIEVLLQDQYPISLDKSIQIELLSSDKASINSETGALSWNLSLAPNETKKVRFKYEIKYPKNKQINL